jgi:Outer membrane lipoprotein carrier protein LolA-like
MRPMPAGSIGARLVAVLLLACWLAPVSSRAADTPALDAVMSLLAQRRHGEADFTEEKFLAMLKAPARSTGRLIYDAPDHLEEQTLTPRPQSVVLDHGILTMRSGTRSRTLALADYPQFAPLIDSIRATLAGDRAALEQAFEVHFDGALEHWQLQLEPHDPKLRATLQQIELTGARDAISQVEIRQRNGDRSLMHITPHG